MTSAGSTTIRVSSLRDHGIDPSPGVRQIRPFAFIESVAVRLTGLALPGGLGLSVPATLMLGPNLSFGFRVPFGSNEFFRAIDPEEELALANVSQLVLDFAPRFEELTLFLNGLQFFRGRRADAEVNGATTRFRLP
jgi:hypothetical protein